MLSVVIPFGGEKGSQEIEDKVKQAMEGVAGDVVWAESWQDGLQISRGEFVSFLTPGDLPGPAFFLPLISVFTSQPSFRKLALVAPHYSGTDLLSSEPYPARVVPFPGAVIRRSAFKDSEIALTGNPEVDSHNVSTDFWNRGLRCYIHPKVCLEYTPAGFGLEGHGLVEPDPKVLTLWKREMI